MVEYICFNEGSKDIEACVYLSLNIAEGILIDNHLKVSEEALFEFLQEGTLAEDNVVRMNEASKNSLSLAEKRAVYALALEANDPIMHKLRDIQACKILLKEELQKRYLKKAKIRVKHVMDSITPSVKKKIDRGLITE